MIHGTGRKTIQRVTEMIKLKNILLASAVMVCLSACSKGAEIPESSEIVTTANQTETTTEVTTESTTVTDTTTTEVTKATKKHFVSNVKKLSEYDADKLTFKAYGFKIDTENNKEMNYEGEITDNSVIDGLWNIICSQQEMSPLESGNMFKGTPYLEIYDENGEKFTVSYTWDREEQGHDDYGMPTISHVGTAFVVSGTKSGRYEADSLQEKIFEETIMNYLTENIVPTEKLWNKNYPTDYIIFIDCYRAENQFSGSFIDYHGNLYEFDYSDRDDIDADNFFDAVWETYCDNEPVRTEICSSDELSDIMFDVIFIDKNAEMSTETDSSISWKQTLYTVDIDNNFELIELRSTGSCSQELQDDTAKKLCEYYDSINK